MRSTDSARSDKNNNDARNDINHEMNVETKDVDFKQLMDDDQNSGIDDENVSPNIKFLFESR